MVGPGGGVQVRHGVGVYGGPAGVGFVVAAGWGAHLGGCWGRHCGGWEMCSWDDERGSVKNKSIKACTRFAVKYLSRG